jgi:aryl-alcohol dehydrogenase-like predicted oxidoreductase
MAATFNQATRKIGDALVSPIGFGVMGISLNTAYGPIDADEERLKVRNRYAETIIYLILHHLIHCTVQVLDAAYENGCRHWDTSDAYGDSEELIGKWCVSFVTSVIVMDTRCGTGSNAQERGTRFF